MLNSSLNKLKVTAKIRGIKGCKSMFKDKLLSALISTESTRNEDHDADPANINKTIKEIRKENRDEDKILRNLDFTFDLEKDYYEPKNLLMPLIIIILKMKV